MNKNHSVAFETMSEYCISDSFVDYNGYYTSSEGFLPTGVDITVTWVKFAHSVRWFLECRRSLSPSPVWPLPICLDSWTWHSRFLCNIALYSTGPCFHHQSHLQLGVVFALALSLHSFWSYFSTDSPLSPKKGTFVSLTHRTRERALLYKQGHYRCNQLWGGHGGGQASNTIPLVFWWERTDELGETAPWTWQQRRGWHVCTPKSMQEGQEPWEAVERQERPLLPTLEGGNPETPWSQTPASRAGNNPCPLFWATTFGGFCYSSPGN